MEDPFSSFYMVEITDFSPAVDYKTFLTILNRPDGFKPAGTPGTVIVALVEN